MKNTNIFPIIFMLTVLIACNKGDSDIEYFIHNKGDQEYGYANAKINGKNWEASAFFQQAPNDSTVFYLSLQTYEGFDGFYIKRENISFEPIFIEFGVGKYELINYEPGVNTFPESDQLLGSFIRIEDDGDVINGPYHLDEKKSNWLNIEEWSLDEGTMSGTFSLHFKKDKEWKEYSKELPNSLNVREGYFNCRLKPW